MMVLIPEIGNNTELQLTGDYTYKLFWQRLLWVF
jgi:hypothetical protein